MRKLFVSRPLPESVLARAHGLAHLESRDDTAPLTSGELRRVLREFDMAVVTLQDAFSDAVFADVPQPRCRLLANFGVGYNHIDVKAARAHGVAVSNTPGAVTEATADIAMTLMLMSARRAGEGERLVRSGEWRGWHPTQMLGFHMSGKKVGIVGMGRIGQAIARRCHFGFGMQVKYFNRSPKEVAFEAERVTELKDLASQVDILVVALPGGVETRHSIDASVFAAMPSHGHFINIARGDIVDERALITALQAGQIAGAGLDVYEFEPAVPETLRSMQNVTLLPHLGTAALEVRTAMGMMALDNVEAFLNGHDLPNAV